MCPRQRLLGQCARCLPKWSGRTCRRTFRLRPVDRDSVVPPCACDVVITILVRRVSAVKPGRIRIVRVVHVAVDVVVTARREIITIALARVPVIRTTTAQRFHSVRTRRWRTRVIEYGSPPTNARETAVGLGGWAGWRTG